MVERFGGRKSVVPSRLGLFNRLFNVNKIFWRDIDPLLLLYTLAERRKVDGSLVFLLIPVGIIFCYEWLSYSFYNHGLLSSAVSYASDRGILEDSRVMEKTLTGLSFTGGCLAGTVFFAPWLWPRRGIPWAIALLILSIAVPLSMKTVSGLELYDETGVRYGFLIQLSLFILAGIHVLILAAADLLENRNSSSLLLFLWVIGVFLFTSYLNWTISGRNILPMLPAAAVLVFRRMSRPGKESKKFPTHLPRMPLILAAMITFLVAWADFSLASAQRSAANTFRDKYGDYPHRVLFQGHWGFQYYMESAGFEAFNLKEYKMKQGDMIIIPVNNSDLDLPDPRLFKLVDANTEGTLSRISVMHLGVGAGFYSSNFGPLPFVIANVPPEEYFVFSPK